VEYSNWTIHLPTLTHAAEATPCALLQLLNNNTRGTTSVVGVCSHAHTQACMQCGDTYVRATHDRHTCRGSPAARMEGPVWVVSTNNQISDVNYRILYFFPWPTVWVGRLSELRSLRPSAHLPSPNLSTAITRRLWLTGAYCIV